MEKEDTDFKEQEGYMGRFGRRNGKKMIQFYYDIKTFFKLKKKENTAKEKLQSVLCEPSTLRYRACLDL